MKPHPSRACTPLRAVGRARHSAVLRAHIHSWVGRVTLPRAVYLTLLLAASSSLLRAEVNDDFSNRAALIGTNLTVLASNTNATKEPLEPDHAANPGGNSVWWSWTAPTNGDLFITTDGSDFDTLLAVYTGAVVNALSEVSSDDDHGVVATSRVRIAALAGTQYQIAVDGFNDTNSVASGNVMLDLEFLPEPIVRPPNDLFTNRIVLTGAAIATGGSTVNASREPGEPLHAGRDGDTSVWWTWTAPADDTVVISTVGSSFDTLLALYTGSNLTNLVEVATSDDIDASNGLLTSSVTNNVTAGTTFAIVVDGFDGASGDVVLTIGSITPRLLEPAVMGNGSFQFVLAGIAGRSYDVEATTNLNHWDVVGSLTNTSGTEVFSDLEATNFTHRFYRAILR